MYVIYLYIWKRNIISKIAFFGVIFNMLVPGKVSKLKQQRGFGHCYIEREKRLGRGGRKFKVAS